MFFVVLGTHLGLLCLSRVDLDRIDRRPDDDMEDIPITTAIHEDSGRRGLNACIFPHSSLMV